MTGVENREPGNGETGSDLAIFIAEHLTKTRTKFFVDRYGEVDGAKRLTTEIELLTRIVRFLDTPGSARQKNRDAFVDENKGDMVGAGYKPLDLMRRGDKLLPKWLLEKHRAQVIEYYKSRPTAPVRRHYLKGRHTRGS